MTLIIFLKVIFTIFLKFFIIIIIFSTIKIESKKESRPCSELLLYEWSTYGPPVPTINDLIYVLNSVKLYRAVDFIQGDILKGTIF